MDTATGVQSVIAQFIEDHKYLTQGSGGNISTKALDQRQTLISQIESITTALRSSIDRLESLSTAAKRLQEEEIRTLDIILGNAKNGKPISAGSASSVGNGSSVSSNVRTVSGPKLQLGQPVPPQSAQKASTAAVPASSARSKPKTLADPAWTLVQRRPRVTDVMKTERIPSPKTLPPMIGNYERINITDSIVLNAIPVRTFSEIKCDGNLYYVTSCAHFAVVINNMMLHGNIGVIYTDAEEPKKIKECKYTDGCSRGEACQYYHDPTIFTRSTDRRNYIASSFVYCNPSAVYSKRSRSRRFGSLKYLDTDMLDLGDEEKSRMYDQAMHDLLCVLVLKSMEPIKK